MAEIRQGLNQGLSSRQRLRVGITSAVASVVSVASVAVLIYFRKPHASFFSDPMPLILGFNAILFAVSSVSNLRRALQKTEHAEAIEPAAGPIFGKVSRYVMSACALALLAFLAASAWIGIRHEFSDQGHALRYAAKGEHDNAIAAFSKAIAAEPRNPDAYLGRAESYSARGDRDRAIADYTSALEIRAPRRGCLSPARRRLQAQGRAR